MQCSWKRPSNASSECRPLAITISAVGSCPPSARVVQDSGFSELSPLFLSLCQFAGIYQYIFIVEMIF